MSSTLQLYYFAQCHLQGQYKLRIIKFESSFNYFKSDSSSAFKEHPRTQQQRSASRMHLTLKRPFVPLCLTPAYRAKRLSAISVAKLLGRIVLFHSGLIVPALHSGALCDTCRTVQVNGRR